LFSLTRREQEVLELVALGHTNTEVAKTLNVALRTVEAHRTHLMHKLGLHTRAEVVRLVADQQRRAGGDG
jgi:DNA-binding NarL/FixJ family response regulator